MVVSTVAMALSVQALASMAMVVPSVLAPVAASDIGVQPSKVGILVACGYVVAVLSGLTSDALISRHGPVRTFQVALMLAGGGLAIAAGGNIPSVLLFALLIGVAYGVVNPASSTILAQAAPPQYRSLVFSIKQTGVPLGGAIAGVLVPALLQWMSWPRALLTLALASALFVAVLQPFRRVYDRDADPRQPLRLTAIARPVAEVLARRELLALALSSAVFSAVQVSLSTYLMLYLIFRLDYSLVAAGLVFSTAQAMGVVGRPIWGAIADRVQAPRKVLAGLGLTMAACGVAAASFSIAWPPAVVTLVCAIYGATAIGWNGVYLAEVARLAPPGKVGMVTGGTQLFTFGGALAAPPVFGAIVGASGSYALGFALIAALPLASGIRLAFPLRR